MQKLPFRHDIGPEFRMKPAERDTRLIKLTYNAIDGILKREEGRVDL